VIRAADSIAKTFGRKDLSLDQKFRLSYDQARQVFKPLVDEAQASIGKMHLGDKLNNAVSLAIPKIIATLAEHAPKAAETFVKGFIDANVWTRLFAVGWLLKKTGGLGAFRTIGASAAAQTATGFAASGAARGATGAAAGAAASRRWSSARAVGAARGVGAAGGLAAFGGPVGVGAAAALILGPSVIKEFTKGSKSMKEALADVDKKARDVSGGSLTEYVRSCVVSLRRRARPACRSTVTLRTGSPGSPTRLTGRSVTCRRRSVRWRPAALAGWRICRRT
jgi:hypothetical protein